MNWHNLHWKTDLGISLVFSLCCLASAHLCVTHTHDLCEVGTSSWLQIIKEQMWRHWAAAVTRTQHASTSSPASASDTHTHTHLHQGRASAPADRRKRLRASGQFLMTLQFEGVGWRSGWRNGLTKNSTGQRWSSYLKGLTLTHVIKLLPELSLHNSCNLTNDWIYTSASLQ